MGWLQRAFVLSFYFLLRSVDYSQKNKLNDLYKDAIRLTIQEGGDTDTNAAIVGGMLGALVGIKNLPKEMVMKVLDFDCTQVDEIEDDYGIPRPDFLNTKKHLMRNIDLLIQWRPRGRLSLNKD